LARGLAARGFHVLTYSQRGHGRSGGALGIVRSLEDLEHVARTRLSEFEGSRFGAGISFGGYVSLLVASRNPGLFRAVAPIAAPHSMKGILPNRAHTLLRGVRRLPLHEPLARLAVPAIKLLIMKKGAKRDYLRLLWTDRRERAQLFTHLDGCRLPARLEQAYEDLLASPELAEASEPVRCPVLLLVGDREDLVHGSGSAAQGDYLRRFRAHVPDLEIRVLPGAGHDFSTASGRSQLEHDPTLVDALTSFFRQHQEARDLVPVSFGAIP